MTIEQEILDAIERYRETPKGHYERLAAIKDEICDKLGVLKIGAIVAEQSTREIK